MSVQIPVAVREKLNDLVAVAKECNVNVVCVLAAYSAEQSADFSTRFSSVVSNATFSVTDNHLLLDCIRELSRNWSDFVHIQDSDKVK